MGASLRAASDCAGPKHLGGRDGLGSEIVRLRASFPGKANPGRRASTIESVHVSGNRAVVPCRIDDSGTATHNVRLFVRGADGEWRVLGWTNEPA